MDTENVLAYPVLTGNPEVICDVLYETLLKRRGQKPRYFSCLNPHSAVVAAEHHTFREALLNSDYILADGVGIVVASKLGGGQITERVTGSDVFEGLSRRMNESSDFSCFFFGGAEDTLNQLVRKYAHDYPKIKIAGHYSPPYAEKFSASELQKICDLINGASPDILWVGLGAPKQEVWIHENLERLQVGMLAPIGAVFDFYTGKVSRASPRLQRLGLEWLPRLLEQPGRLWRRTLVSAPVFLWMVLKDRLGGRFN